MFPAGSQIMQRKKRTWGEWLTGKKKPEELVSEDVSEHGDASEHGEIASLFQNLSSEERDSLFSTENAGVHGYGSLTKSENVAQLMFSLTATLESVSLRLIDVGGKLDSTASFTHAALGFIKRNNVFEVGIYRHQNAHPSPSIPSPQLCWICPKPHPCGIASHMCRPGLFSLWICSAPN